MNDKKKQAMPITHERPDLYDNFDGIDRPEGWVNPSRTPDRIQRLIDERKKSKQDGGNQPAPKT